MKEKEAVQERYEHMQESLRLLREELESSLAEYVEGGREGERDRVS